MNCRIYIFKQVIFPRCNIQNSDLHEGQLAAARRPRLATRDCSFTLPSPGGGEAGDGRAAFLWLCSNFHPAILGLEFCKCLYSPPHVYAAPEPSYLDFPFKVKPSSCPALVVGQFVRNSHQVVMHRARDHELSVCPERDQMSGHVLQSTWGRPWKG